MDERLVQDLATQLDGQIAQACGSQDPNVKGNYVWSNYPQVHSCGTYYDAIMLLAKEQATLQMQATQNATQGAGFGQAQVAGFGQGAGFGQTQGAGFGQAQGAGFGQVQGAGFGQTQGAGFGQAQGAGFGQAQGASFNGMTTTDGVQNQGMFGQPPTPGVFGTPVVPQTGQSMASQFTAFQEKSSKKKQGKGILSTKVTGVILIVLLLGLLVFGIVRSVLKLNSKDNESKLDTPQVETNVSEDTTDINNLFD